MTENTPQSELASMAGQLIEFYRDHGGGWEDRLRAAATDWAIRSERGHFMSLWHFVDGSELVETSDFKALEPVQ